MSKKQVRAEKPNSSRESDPAVIDDLFAGARRSHQAGNLAEAEALYRRILSRDPRHADAMHLLGVLADQSGRPEEAVDLIEQAIAINDASFYRNNFGNVLRRLGRFDEAAAHYARAVALKPGNTEAHYNLGNLRLDQGCFAEAEACYRQAIIAKPGFALAYMNLGNALRLQERLDEAEACYARAAELKPDYAEAHYNYGNTLQDRGAFEDAAACFRCALALRPDYTEALLNLGNALRSLGQFGEALASYRRAVQIRPGYAEAYVNEAMTLLLAGDFAAGWPQYEWRWRSKNAKPHGLAAPLWDGGDFAGKTILLHAEQGLGDSIQFVRYAPLVKAKGGTVFLSCPASLTRLFQSVPGIDRVIADGADLPAYDVQAPLMSLPMLFGTRLDTIPCGTPYLAPAAELAVAWAKKIPHGGDLKIGLVWAGTPLIDRPDNRAVDRRRSLKLERLTPLASVPNLRFFSLQKGAAGEEAKNPPPGMNLIDLMDEVEDFADTAALIAGLDLVIGAMMAAGAGSPNAATARGIRACACSASRSRATGIRRLTMRGERWPKNATDRSGFSIARRRRPRP